VVFALVVVAFALVVVAVVFTAFFVGVVASALSVNKVAVKHATIIKTKNFFIFTFIIIDNPHANCLLILNYSTYMHVLWLDSWSIQPNLK